MAETEEDGTAEALALGCGFWLAAVAMTVMVALALLGSGCRTYTVVAADREVVPVCQNGTLEDGRKTYIETEAHATGWYVPDATLLDLLDAD